MAKPPISNTIFASRDGIRQQITEYVQQYMELENVDLSQSSFLSFIIDILSTLSSNLMFYETNIYKEFFLTQAQLPESIHNLSTFIGYNSSEAEYAVASILVEMPLTFTDDDTSFTIKEGFEFKTGDGVPFITDYETIIEVTSNTNVKITTIKDNRSYDIPVEITTEDVDEPYFTFVLPVSQYKIVSQEFQIDEDLQLYQFTHVEVPLSGKVADIDVYVRDPDADTNDTGLLYSEFQSLYLMSNTDYGYVLRTSKEGRKLYFGNNVIGKQPLPGSTVITHVKETLGSEGNVIAGSITVGERIYAQQNDVTTIVNYSVTNPTVAHNGKDEESLQDIRSNSIKALTALNRLVSEGDYKSTDVVVPDAPIRPNSVPVLKRSDLKVNEIQLFTILEYGGDIVPTRNIFMTFDIDTTYIPRNTIMTFDGVDYISLFEITIEHINDAGFYQYILNELTLSPSLVESYGHDNQDPYHVYGNDVDVTAGVGEDSVTFNFSYYSNESDFADLECIMKILSSNDEYTMTNVPGTAGGEFTYKFDDYLDFPEGLQTVYFTISNPNLPHQTLICQYSIELTFRRHLNSFMLSNTVSDETSFTLYDIPVILNSWYDDQVTKDFEKEVLQAFLTSADIKSYRMLTDFINIKFSNTTGKSYNMLLNDVVKQSVIDIDLSSVPSPVNLADVYITSGLEGGSWEGKKNKYATCTDEVNETWSFLDPVVDDVAYVQNKDTKYIFSEYGFTEPIYDIPIKIELEIFKDNTSVSPDSNIITDVKEALYEYYSDKFGPEIDLKRSKIIDIVHNVEGVSHCRLVEPRSNVFFNFDINNFTQQELLEYSPDWIFFTKDDITIKLFTV